jgi:hypothetical protein
MTQKVSLEWFWIKAESESQRLRARKAVTLGGRSQAGNKAFDKKSAIYAES